MHVTHFTRRETTSEQRLTAHNYKHMILEWIVQTAPFDVRIFEIIYREISFKSLYAPMMYVAAYSCCFMLFKKGLESFFRQDYCVSFSLGGSLQAGGKVQTPWHRHPCRWIWL